jgi:large conductance mechanosensitive channel
MEENMLTGFRQFLLRGNVVDMAVGIVLGASFGAVTSGLVKDLPTPLIAAIVKQPDFSMLTFRIKGSRFIYGQCSMLISFLIITTTIDSFVVVPVNALVARSRKEPPADPATKQRPECGSEIASDARRCAFCTSQL